MKKSEIIGIGLILGALMLPACATTEDLGLTACDCYQVAPVSEESFVMEDNKTIVPVEIGCKDGYFITKIKMQPQTDPKSLGQYIITSEITCCRPCQEGSE